MAVISTNGHGEGRPLSRLSSPIQELEAHYPVVVVGSGYGGAITASRLARAGQQVCVLERGRELHPGEYPDTGPEVLEEMQLHFGGNLVGRRTGLYDLRLGDDVSVFMGCGLGGTSLVNANVSIPPDPRVFDDPCWPRDLVADLDSGFRLGMERARAILRPTPVPESATPHKLAALEESSRVLADAQFSRASINVTFEEGTNPVGVTQPACTFCGDCVSGCNEGAKNTVLMNYLPDAHAHGARIFTQVAVRHLERDGGRWRLQCQLLETGRERFDAPLVPLTADVVVLAAGTLGTTELLLRSARDGGVPLSPALGTRFTGNGDVLGFSYNGEREIDGVGWGHRRSDDLPPVGPCITGIIDLRDGDAVDDGIIIEEGSVPGGLGPFMPVLMAAAAKAVGKDTDRGIGDEVREQGREVDSVVRGPYRGAMRNTQTYLVMGHDGSDGRLELDGDRVKVTWPGVGDRAVFRMIDERLVEATRPLGGTFVKNPLWTELLGNDLITVHPLGGCPMADDAEHGVVNHQGQVFAGPTGTSAYDNLYVSDGSVIPRSLGVNPLLTISALAERCCALIADEHGWAIDYDSAPSPPPPPASTTVGIEFTERMRGWVSTVVTDDYEAAARRGEHDGSPMSFVLTVVGDDLDRMAADPDYTARMVGTVTAPALSPEPLAATDGVFNLLVGDRDVVGLKQMRYRMLLTAVGGKRYLCTGFKDVRDDGGLDVWPDTTTLYVTVHDGENESSPVAARGILRIDAVDFAQLLRSMRVLRAPDTAARLRAEARFGLAFAGQLYRVYGGVFAGPVLVDPDAPPRKVRPLRAGPPTLHPFRTADGVELLLTRYRGGDKGPVLLSHGLGVSSRIFSLDTVHTNLVEYLVAAGYDVWLLDFRASIELPASRTTFTGDDIARYDYPAAVDAVRAATGAPDVQVVAHCFGSTTFFMAMLAGLEGVRSAVASQVATHVVAPRLTKLKAGIRVPEVLDALGVESLTAFAHKKEAWYERLFDRALSLWPVGEEERCTSAVCHRISFLYALLYEHDRLEPATHDTLHELFGVADIHAFEHLARLVREGVLVTADGKDDYMPHLERLALPITFIHGAENECFLPESTQLTVEALSSVNDPGLYHRVVVPGYGHIDCIFGADAADDVYPAILHHLEST